MKAFSRDLMGMARAEVESAIAAGAPFLVPTGSIEQHGPHLPFGTDYLAAWALANLAAEHLGGVCVPFCPIGITPIHMPYAGTLSLEPATFRALLEDTARSLIRHGVKRIGVVNWHELNTPAIQLTLRALAARHAEDGVRFAIAEAHMVAKEKFGPVAGGLTHGGEIETYPVLALEPDWVHLDRAAASPPVEQPMEMDRMRREAAVQPILWDVRQISPAGWYGTPGNATPDRADAFMTQMGSELADRIGAAFEMLR